MSSDYSALRSAAEQFARQVMSKYDASHDFSHVNRVRNLALTIGKQEGLNDESLQVIELAALLHDVGDHKYVALGGPGPEAVEGFLKDQNYSEAQRVLDIIAKMGFKEELNGDASRKASWPIELKVVQDADRLDAIGAVGIARCLTFGGKFDRVLYDPDVPPRNKLSKEEYVQSAHKQTTVNHFYEKLLLLKDMMNTASGKRIADGRHKYMEEWLDRFYKEWDGQC